MRNIILTLALLFSTASALLSSEGWQKLSWGMSLEQVKREYPKAVVNDPPKSYRQKGVEYKSPLRIKEYEIAGRSYFVDFLFDSDKTLAGTTLGTPKEGGLEKGNLRTDYENIRDLLTQKYGPPVDIKPWGEGSESTIWNASRTEIRLNYILSEILGESGIRMLYLEKRTEQLDKL